jgi:hypothetical protein
MKLRAVGAAWMDARERGTEREVDDFLLEFFKPARWPQWQPMLQEMLRTGPQKRQGKVAQCRLNKAKRQREAAVKEAAKVAGVKAAGETVQGSLGRTSGFCVWFAADQSATAAPRHCKDA